jgi:hypothetical protein
MTPLVTMFLLLRPLASPSYCRSGVEALTPSCMSSMA